MDVNIKEHKDGSADFSFDFDLDNPEDVRCHRRFALVTEAMGGDVAAVAKIFTPSSKARDLIFTICESIMTIEGSPSAGLPQTSSCLTPTMRELREKLLNVLGGVIGAIEAEELNFMEDPCHG